MNITSQYELVKGSISGVTCTCDRVFRRGSTFAWKHYTLDPGIGTPYVWGVGTCPTCSRLFIQPPRLPVEEMRESLREAIHRSLDNPHIDFKWAEEVA